ncbi:uncharacterized protein PFLUO_LOCUS2823 [Penicillium psychrofluorescens]|uniref:uncharacterized protein n=1 Tax=Penicillium psychrofluorescens TaxID=3158075 RepID=UPI003CCD86AF
MAIRLNRLLRQPYHSCPGSSFSTSAGLLSGHSKWATIRHDKAKNDKAKSKERQLVSKEIRNATQLWGPNPKFNPRLTLALSNAKRASIPKTVIEAAIARGQGLSLTGQALESITIEAILPGSVAAVIECQTDQKARVLQDIRFLIKDNGGSISPTTYLFEKKGRVVMEKKDGVDLDNYLDQAIEAGAADLTADERGRLVVFTDPSGTKSVGEKFSKLSGLEIEEIEIIWDPNQDGLVKKVDEEHAKILENLLAALREEPSVQEIYLNPPDIL